MRSQIGSKALPGLIVLPSMRALPATLTSSLTSGIVVLNKNGGLCDGQGDDVYGDNERVSRSSLADSCLEQSLSDLHMQLLRRDLGN